MKIFTISNSPNYYLRIYTGGRDKWISLKTSNRKQAEMRAARIKYNILPKLHRLAMDKPPIDIDLIGQEYLRTEEYQRLKPSTAEMNVLYLNKFLDYCRKHRVRSTKDISEYLASEYLSSLTKIGPKTHNNYKITLSAIWKAIGEDDIWRDLKSRPLKTTPMRGFSDDEVSAIFKAVAFDPFFRPACTIALYTGLRLEDIVCLRRDQIKKDKYIELKPSKTERSGRAVYIPLHPAVKKELNMIKSEGKYFFPEFVSIYKASRHVIPMRFRRILKGLKIILTDSGKAGFHSWRVTFASRAQDNGIPAETIRAILGHTTKAMTQHYIDSPESLNLDLLPDVKISS